MCGRQVKLCDTSLTHAILEHFIDDSHEKALQKSTVTYYEARQVLHTCVPVAKKYNLVPAKMNGGALRLGT